MRGFSSSTRAVSSHPNIDVGKEGEPSQLLLHHTAHPQENIQVEVRIQKQLFPDRSGLIDKFVVHLLFPGRSGLIDKFVVHLSKRLFPDRSGSISNTVLVGLRPFGEFPFV